MFNISFCNDWIRTTDLWYTKRPLYQRSHNHCPKQTILQYCPPRSVAGHERVKVGSSEPTLTTQAPKIFSQWFTLNNMACIEADSWLRERVPRGEQQELGQQGWRVGGRWSWHSGWSCHFLHLWSVVQILSMIRFSLYFIFWAALKGQNWKRNDIVCGASGKAIAGGIRGPGFKSSRRQIVLNVFLRLTLHKTNENEKEMTISLFKNDFQRSNLKIQFGQSGSDK